MPPQRDDATPHRSSGRAVARLVVVLVVGVVLVVEAVLLVARRADGDPHAPARLRPVADRSLRAARPEVRAADLLADWDRRRADAWAAGDEQALLGLYTEGSAAGRRDRDMLAAWRGRGLRVVDLRTQVVRLRVLAHRPGRWELEVVDRLVGGTVLAGSAGVPVVEAPLPQDAPSTRRVVLVAGPTGGWRVSSVLGRVARVSAAPPPAPP